jgi:hypothetical protein
MTSDGDLVDLICFAARSHQHRTSFDEEMLMDAFYDDLLLPCTLARDTLV